MGEGRAEPGASRHQVGCGRRKKPWAGFGREDHFVDAVDDGVALNIVRLDTWWTTDPLRHPRTSRLERLNYQLAG